MRPPAPLSAAPTVLRRCPAGRTRGHGWAQAAATVVAFWVWLLVGWLPYPAVAAEPARVEVLLSETAGAHAELLQSLTENLAAAAPGRIDLASRLVPDESVDRRALLARRPSLIVTVGIRASALMLREADGVPVLSLLVPYHSYNSLPHAADGLHSAIYLDQPLERQLELLKLVLPDARRLATLAGPHSGERAAELRALCAERGLSLTSTAVDATTNPVPAISRLLDHAEVLLALPDPAVFNRNNLQAVLLTTYRSGVPVIGFSHAYVRAGALAAVHSTAAQIGAQAAEWIGELSASGRWHLGPPRHPAYYSVAINPQVAQTLGIPVANEQSLLDQLRKSDLPTDVHATGQRHP